MNYELKRVNRDGNVIVKFMCPKCGIWATIDKDQFFGLVSCQCDCGFHETINFARYEQGKAKSEKELIGG